ncbi:formate dehydrogenase subunit alpha [Desulfobacca acetoxidans]|uniref:Formate dehydrogenase, alpha subunit n=1 Tax=Desulfobacca acetoxidans (strain ATCC 700848 / DSM 11109 / ASRB2) TaxID=880072 RepID=F2NH93_DESAR|nr:formate dehydrogenase subunit alpha [Desulfobacca acetoxidans]AEB08935.1 formate dehydrogenase, alpha subunit [Desulfobacca acetoxidans DSM 11109]
MNNVTLKIDGKMVDYAPGQTILEAARSAGIYTIPTLCHMPLLKPTGSCRICVVEVEGWRTLVTACSTAATPGMVIQTESERVVAARKNIIELMLASGNHNCLICEANGECELQALAYRYQVPTPTFANPPDTTYYYEDNNSMIVRDFSKCIMCGRCVRICNERQVNEAIQIGYRGHHNKIVTRADSPYIDSDCVFCGQCVQACPVGALIFKEARYQGRPWELRKVRTTCPYCGVGCQLELNLKGNKIVKVMGVRAIPNEGRLCVKGRFGMGFVNHPDRLKTPLVKKNGELVEASWDEALDLVTSKFKEMKEKYGPEKMGGFSSARVTNEENYLMQKFMRAVIGTNHVDHCARLCHASTVAGLATTYGSGAMTNSIMELEDADCILVIGSNPNENHPVIGTYIKRAAKLKNKDLIVIDPRRQNLVRYARLWLRQFPGTDIAVINGMMHVIIAENLHAVDYIAERTENFEAVKETVSKYTPEYVEKISGVPAAEIIAAARLYAKAPAASIVFCMGITQHTVGTDNVKTMSNLAMLCGNVGIPHAGVNPLRGQNNVQGACDMGALPNVYSGYQAVTDPANRAKMEAAWGVAGLPDYVGMTLTQMIPAISEGGIKSLYIMGENPAMSDPDCTHAIKEMQGLEFMVVQDIFLTETAKLADVVLPACTFAEKDGTFTNTERRVARVRRAIPPIGQSKPDWQIISEISTRMGYPMNYKNAEEIFEEIRTVTPSYAGMTYERLESGGLQWPCPTIEHPGTQYLHKGQFTRGKGLFFAIEHQDPAEMPDADYPLYLTTGRLLYQYHTGTMSRKAVGLNEKAPECRVELSPTDAEAYKIASGDMVRVTSRRGAITAKAEISRKAVAGTIFIPFHFAEAAANTLTIAALDPVCKIPEFKVCAARIERA